MKATVRFPVLTGVFMTSMATVVLELALTRLFSVLLYYHFAFMAISIALLGLGAGGLLGYRISRDGTLERLGGRLAFISSLNAVVTVFSLVIILHNQLPVVTLDSTALGRLATIYIAATLPFISSGIVLSVVIARAVENAGKVYFADLMGGSAGGLLLIPLLNILGAPNTIIVSATMFAASSIAWWSLRGRRQAWRAMVAPAVLVAVMVANARLRFIDVIRAKGRDLSDEVFNRWNSFSRVGVAQDPDGLYIRIDADAASRVAEVPLSNAPYWRGELEGHGSGVAHVLADRHHPGYTALIIGPGGGYDVARALAAGAGKVQGIEINPIIVRNVMLGVAKGMSHSLYARDDVAIAIGDGRSYIRRSRDRYGVIQATLVDTWASTAAGAFALTENNLYTVDAFQEYLRHLEPAGFLSVTRWEFEQPREALRLVSLALAALVSEGVRRPASQILVVSDERPNVSGSRTTVLVKRTPFTADDLAVVERLARQTGMVVLYRPDRMVKTVFTDLVNAPDVRRFQDDYPFDIAPVWDNRPFFFFNVRMPAITDLWNRRDSMDRKVNLGIMMLSCLVLISLLAVCVLLVLPARLGAPFPGGRRIRSLLAIIAAIGLGYMLVEVACIQSFVLFLGHPTYALTVAVSVLLVTSGLGSLWTGRYGNSSLPAHLGRMTMLSAAYIVILGAAVTRVLPPLVYLPLGGRVVVSLIILAPAGLLMGTAFPMSLRLVGRRDAGAVQWAWAINATSSVLGSLLAVFISIHLGIWQTLASGAACYLGACGLSAGVHRSLKGVLGARGQARPGAGSVDVAQ